VKLAFAPSSGLSSTACPFTILAASAWASILVKRREKPIRPSVRDGCTDENCVPACVFQEPLVVIFLTPLVWEGIDVLAFPPPDGVHCVCRRLDLVLHGGSCARSLPRSFCAAQRSLFCLVFCGPYVFLESSLLRAPQDSLSLARGPIFSSRVSLSPFWENLGRPRDKSTVLDLLPRRIPLSVIALSFLRVLAVSGSIRPLSHFKNLDQSFYDPALLIVWLPQ